MKTILGVFLIAMATVIFGINVDRLMPKLARADCTGCAPGKDYEHLGQDGKSMKSTGTVRVAPWINTPSYLWDPQNDLTARELALALPILLSQRWDTATQVEKLAPEIRRHFKEQKQ